MNRTFPRPRRPFTVYAPALDAPLPLLVTCAGMRLPWPAGHAAAPDVRPMIAERLADSIHDDRAA